MRSKNIALLIDADNAKPDSLDTVLTILGDLGTVNVRRAYGNWSKPGLKGWSAPSCTGTRSSRSSSSTSPRAKTQRT